ncbi:MAG: DUF3429 domain-containing protein [Gammaproteobacteria bacterium]
MEQNTATRVPANAAWLGGLGALPFIGLALLSIFSNLNDALALLALSAYGAVILSFLGGIHWGLAIGRAPDAPSTAALILSVVPSLIGWVALLLERELGLLVLAAAVAAMFFVDTNLTQRRMAPIWYPRLRLPLTLTVVTCLLGSALAA